MKTNAETELKARKLGHNGMFATYSTKELMDYMESMTGKEKAIAGLFIGLTWNCLSYQIAEREGEK